jgi:hypothetical protein
LAELLFWNIAAHMTHDAAYAVMALTQNLAADISTG